jgi:hypothetical protein
MNCCDEFGNCRQGRDCPVRKEMQRQREEAHKTQGDRVGTLLVIVAVACAIAVIVNLYWSRI